MIGAAAPRGLALTWRRPSRSLSSSAFSGLTSIVGGGSSSSDAVSKAGVHAPRFHVGVVVVPQQIAWVVERLGKFHQVLDPGLHFLVPVVDRVSYAHSLKEEAIAIPNQQAITKDNVTISIDGVLFLRVVDAYQASYGVHDPLFAVTQLAQTSMRSEIGKMTLDRTFEERDTMNLSIVKSVNAAAQAWGIEVLRYEIRDIIPPSSIKQAMEMQAEAERRRRAEVLQSEGDRQSEINLADGRMQAAKLQAKGEAEAIRERARATAEGIRLLSSAISDSKGGEQAASLRVAEQWVGAWKEMAKKSNTMIVPANPQDPAAMVATAMSVFRQVSDATVTADIPPADGAKSAFHDETFEEASGESPER